MRHHKAKDSNNKVCTAKGLKDRRIRLSPNTAIQLYDVQDRLGFDRSSMAIDWLMKEAKVAIDALNDDHQNHLSYDCTNSFDNYSYAVTNSVNRCETPDEYPIVVPQEINLFSTSSAPMDFNWNTNYNKEEGTGFACREPLQPSFSSSIAHTSSNQFASDNRFLGFPFDQEIRAVQEDEKHSINVAKHCRHYQD